MGAWLLVGIEFLLAAQVSEGGIAGTVRDEQGGEPLANVVVSLPDLGRHILTGSSGRYAFDSVPAGPHHLTARRIGFWPRSLHALVPRVGRLQVDVVLERRPVVLTEIRVLPIMPLRGTEPEASGVFPDRTVSLAAVRQHPLLSEPDVLLALRGGEIVAAHESPNGLHVRGGASDQTAYVLDGIPVFSPYHTAGTFSAWNPDALERVQTSSSAPARHFPDALSAVVSGTVRRPASQLQVQGSVSTSQGRLTADGPLGRSGAGILASVRTAFPGFLAPPREASYLRGASGDVLVKLVSAPIGTGRLEALGYDGRNAFDASVFAEGPSAPPLGVRRHDFRWHSRSWGLSWSQASSERSSQIQVWRAIGDANAHWDAPGDSHWRLRSRRREYGLTSRFGVRTSRGLTTIGAWMRQGTTAYRVDSGSAPGMRVGINARTPMLAAFLQHQVTLRTRVTLDVGMGVVAVGGNGHLNPEVRWRWDATPQLTLSAGYNRAHQFSQSLRNPESLVGSIFPADLHVGTGRTGVPVARGDQVVLAAHLRPAAGVAIGWQVYARSFDGLLLVAPATGEPFVTGDFRTGSGSSVGASAEASISSARFGIVASYGWQQTRFQSNGQRLVPSYGPRHVAEAGVIVFPSTTLSLRAGITAGAGRRATPVAGNFEWEACNVLDRGCEFGGSPTYVVSALATTRLPPYLGLDVGVRKHWHRRLAGRDVLFALFGTITNIFGRTNLLTMALDPGTGQATAIEMRPRAPLVVGLDWSF